MRASAAVMLVCQSTSVPNTSKAITSTSTAHYFPGLLALQSC